MLRVGDVMLFDRRKRMLTPSLPLHCCTSMISDTNKISDQVKEKRAKQSPHTRNSASPDFVCLTFLFPWESYRCPLSGLKPPFVRPNMATTSPIANPGSLFHRLHRASYRRASSGRWQLPDIGDRKWWICRSFLRHPMHRWSLRIYLMLSKTKRPHLLA